MNIFSLTATVQAVAPFTLFIAAKATLLLLLATLLALSLRRRSAAARHLVWSLALGGVTLLPLAALMTPEIPVLPAPATATPTLASAGDEPRGSIALEVTAPGTQVAPPLASAA